MPSFPSYTGYVPGSSTGRVHPSLLHIFVLLVLGAVFFFFRLNALPLLDRDETRYAVMAKTMVQNHDWVVSWLNHQPHLDKPPMFVWLVALSFKTFGISEVTARLVPLLMGLGALILAYLLGCLFWNRRTGLLAAFILLFSPEYFGLSRFVNTDMTLTFFSTLAVYSFLAGIRLKRPVYFISGYMAFGCAMLTKGPVGIALPGLVILSYLWLTGNISRWLEMKPWWGILIILAIALPWYWMAEMRLPGYLYFFFVKENLLRFFTKIHSRSEPFYFFIPVVLGGMFPWILYLPKALIKQDGQAWYRDEGRLITILWFLIGFGFFSLSKAKLPTYILPYLIPLALFLASGWDQLWNSGIKHSYWVSGILVILGGVLVLSGVIVPFSKLRPEIVEAVGWPMYPEGIILIGMGLLPALMGKLFRTVGSFVVLAILSFLLIAHVCLYDEIPRFAKSNSFRETRTYLAPRLQKGDRVLVQEEHRWSVEFYLPGGTNVQYIPHLEVLTQEIQKPGKAWVFFKKEKDYLAVRSLLKDQPFPLIYREGRQVLAVKD